MSRQILHRGRKIQVALETTVLSNGHTIQRDVILHPGAVAILPLLEDGKVCLVRNHRPAVEDTLLEIPAGTLEPGEAPEAAAVRELAEETGYQAGSWRKLTVFAPSPGLLSELTHLYVAQELRPGTMHPEQDEELEPTVVTLDQALAWVLDGTIRDAKTIIAMLWWNHRGERGASAP